MIIEDEGHKYLLNPLDGHIPITLTFVKREGVKYPNNVGAYSGTTSQEVLRALINRTLYVNSQIPFKDNIEVLKTLRRDLVTLEERAAKLHNLRFTLFIKLGSVCSEQMTGYEEIEIIPVCRECGHIVCKGHLYEQQR